MRKTWPLLLIATLILFPGRGFVFSQEANKEASSSAAETLYKGEMKSIGANVPTRVVIGKPEIADILTVSTKEIMVVGKGTGSTNLIWWDQRGEHSVLLKVLSEDMGYINTRINALIKGLNLPNVSTRPSDSEGKVFLLGSVKSQEDVERIRTALGGALFAKTTDLISIDEEKAIIELEVEVIEVDTGSTKDLGMDWLGSGSTLKLIAPDRWPKLGDVPDSLFRVSEWTHDPLEATLKLLVSEGKARILSRPKLACQSGKSANLLIGGEVPIMTTQVASDSGSGTSVEYKEYGIKLKMSPILNSDGKINFKLDIDVSDIAATADTLGGVSGITARAYPLTKRATSTELYLNNNQTLAISGLIQQKTSEQLSKFPWLGDIPILGLFFRTRTIRHGGGSAQSGDTELVILVTPSVVEENSKNKKESEEKNNPFSPIGQDPQAAKAATRQSPQGDSASSGMAALPINPPGGYTQQIDEYLKNNISYPWAAKQAKIEGKVVINLHLAKNGDLLESNVGDSSGYSVLDEHTISIARRIAPYPSFPRDVSEQDLWVQIPIVYNINQKR